MFTIFVRRTPPSTPEPSPPSSPMERNFQPPAVCNCPACQARRHPHHAMPTQPAIRPAYAAPLIPASSMAVQYGIGGNIAYPYSPAGPVVPYQPGPIYPQPVPMYPQPGALAYRPSQAPGHCNCHIRSDPLCRSHPCQHRSCVAKWKEAAEKMIEEQRQEHQKERDKTSAYPICEGCQQMIMVDRMVAQKGIKVGKKGNKGKKEKEEEDQKWWSLAVPGKEGVVVGMFCVIL